jgi:hypothetical protein
VKEINTNQKLYKKECQMKCNLDEGALRAEAEVVT